jgi:hypothetical protein
LLASLASSAQEATTEQQQQQLFCAAAAAAAAENSKLALRRPIQAVEKAAFVYVIMCIGRVANQLCDDVYYSMKQSSSLPHLQQIPAVLLCVLYQLR